MALGRERLRRSSAPVQALLCAAAALALASVLQATGALRAVEHATHDFRVRNLRPSRGDAAAAPPIVLVLIDQKSLDFYARKSGRGWPWRRDLHAAMIEALGSHGARVIAFDVIFSEPSEAWPEDDEAFALATAGLPPVHHAFDAIVEAEDDRRPAELDEEMASRRALRVDDRSAIRWRTVNQLNRPIPLVENAAAGVGSVHFEADRDGQARSSELLVRYGDHLLPSLPLSVAMDLLGEDGREPSVDERHVLSLGASRIPLTKDGRMLLRFVGPKESFPSYSAAAIIEDHVRALQGEPPLFRYEKLDGAAVLIGANLPMDMWQTPHHESMTGVEIQANTLWGLLTGTAIAPSPAWAGPIACALLAALGALAVVLLQRPATSAAIAVGLAAAHLALALGLFQWRGLLVPIAYPLTGLLGALVLGSVVSRALEGRERRFLRKAFEHYLSPQVIDEILEDPDQLRLGGVRRELTVFFSDLEGFTTMGERLAPEDLVAVLNRYFSEMTSIVLEREGTLDKYVGDAIMAFWGAPLRTPQHGRLACLAALASVRRLREMEPELDALGARKLRLRIGLATGPAVVGNMGSIHTFNYTAMGDVVNLGSRLEGANKIYGTSIMASDATREAAGPGFTWRELDLVRVKGKESVIRVHQLVGSEDEVTDVQRRLVELQDAALAAFRARRFDEAAASWRQALELEPRDGPSRVMLDRCARWLEAPPPPDWQGEHVMLEK